MTMKAFLLGAKYPGWGGNADIFPASDEQKPYSPPYHCIVCMDLLSY